MKKSMKKRTVVHLAAVVCACALAASAISTLPVVVKLVVARTYEIMLPF